MGQVANLATYHFFDFADYRERREPLRAFCQARGLKGTILLSPEGINLFVAGRGEGIDDLVRELEAISGCGPLRKRISHSEKQPFRRMLVRLKREIIAFGVEGVDPAVRPAPRIEPAELRRWLDEGRDVVLLDTRNRYEVRQGTFRHALDPEIDTFRAFPEAVASLPEEMKERPVVVFCTGGIRCEKAAPFMVASGFRDVRQLDGGILRYFEECGGAHFEGECFVFDQRTGVDARLRETESVVCHACRQPLTAAEAADERYVSGRSCPHCYDRRLREAEEAMRKRQQALDAVTDPLPGLEPYENRRPFHVPLRHDGLAFRDLLDALFPHGGAAHWRELLEQGRFRDAAGRVVAGDHVVRAADTYWHVTPGLTEPPVAVSIRLLYEDEDMLVLDKPAPLPMHPCGRFNRHSLQYFLNKIYAPEKPKPAHRLDANVAGLVVFGRRRAMAAALQEAFKSRVMCKRYTALVRGVPEEEQFECALPVSRVPGQGGGRSVDEEGRQALTRFRLICTLPDGLSLIEAEPVTGRTNQIRLHLQAMGLPIVGDPLYGGQPSSGSTDAPATLRPGDPPVCLHASGLEFDHPATGRAMRFESSPPWIEEDVLLMLVEGPSSRACQSAAPEGVPGELSTDMARKSGQELRM